jgi:hypothetical protein
MKSKKRKKKTGSLWISDSIQKMRIDAINQYLKKYNWLEEDKSLNVFKIINFKEHFSKTENLNFEEAVDAIRIYEKIDFTKES